MVAALSALSGLSAMVNPLPFPLDNVLAWWDFTNPGNTLDTNTTTTISYVLDKSGNGRHLQQGSKSLQPDYTAGQGATFNSTQVMSMISAGLPNFIRNTQKITSAALVKSNVSGSVTQLIWGTGTNLSTTSPRIRHQHNNGAGSVRDLFRLYNHATQGNTNDTSGSDTSALASSNHTNNTAKGHICVCDLSANTLKMYVNGTLTSNLTPYAGSGRWTSNSNVLVCDVGNISATGTAPLKGTIRDIIIWNTAIDDATRAKVDAYFAGRLW